ncbi:heterokaryon incompatibility protein Het-C-domain-containing protein [Immersiella caudata]|uniref:Heterokaryon incompatibility protein Het-C-domain-containing protein n=1 Tax=Immersiella caudata TaxID=314043 RepID=A0AA40CD38_9PEZI|nr:heterokaryon incompatibility protein Het-C-domain-containing protein [Immersiella caudata]
MAGFKAYPILLGLVVLFLFARPTHAFGAGNIAGISSVEGQNWRHGDIEDALLQILMARAVGGKKFDKLMVSRVYFGNWLRDYSQAIDVGTVKSVSAEAIRLLLCVLGFLTFGYGSREFEVTAERLGCYRPEDHIDNPKNYADNEDARQYDRRLRAPVDEGIELAVDPETGMKNYIANERANIMTSALHVRRLFRKCIELGRSYSRSNNKDELYEALRLLGTGLHCLEDFFAHSNYVELALTELGERDVFPHVGRDTKLRIPGARGSVYPLVTGTFGGVDFLHSVTGEVSDKMIQSEIQDLEGTLQESQNKDTSMLRDLLDKIPSGLFGGDDKKAKMDDLQNNAAAAQMEQVTVSPRDSEEFTLYIQNVFAQLKPTIEFHDDLLQTLSQKMSQIPVLPKIIEQLEEQLSLFVFSIIAPFIIPVIDQIKNELATGATEIIESSKNEQHNVFYDDNSTDPTHSMLSKDHFSNVLNEIAGRTASKIVSWSVPQLMECWDDEGKDIDSTLDTIIYGILHHPAQREEGNRGITEGRALIFQSVEEWWNGMSEDAREELRGKLSREGVQRGENHKEGVHDTGHGCGGKLHMHKINTPETIEDKIANAAVGAIMGGVKQGFSNIQSQASGYGGSSAGYGGGSSSGGALAGLAGGGALGGLAAGFLGGGGGGGGGGDSYGETQSSYRSADYGDSGYSQSQYTERTEYSERSGGYNYEERTETQYGGDDGYSRREESYSRRENDEPQEEYRREEYRREEEPQQEEESSGGFLGDIARRAQQTFDESRGGEEEGERKGWW